ncbi:MAG: hypothetical protein QOH96_2374 [Blastocatellia bacterium]|jgi:DNA-directed RNA polymerase specialized sigma24 family protein|nr:hypothetical protein [Blastocatellia bacterium]
MTIQFPGANSDEDTGIGGPYQGFPVTHRSIVAEAASDDSERRTLAYEAIIGSYWKPAYKYIRIKWRQSNEDAKDLTQSFFATSMEKQFFASYNPDRAGFRTFLRTCIDHFVSNEKKSGDRLKRGGAAIHLALDFEGAENELNKVEVIDELSMDDYFRHEWVRSLFSIAVEHLKSECEQKGKSVHFELFELYDLEECTSEKLSYADLAERFQIPVTAATNYLAFARREFRRIVLLKLRELTGSDDEFRTEARMLLGVDIP